MGWGRRVRFLGRGCFFVLLFLAILLASIEKGYAQSFIPKRLGNSLQVSDSHQSPKLMSNEQIALLYLSCGHANLISRNFSSAIEDYLKTLDALGEKGDSGVYFLALFGMIVAYDNLGLSDYCASASLQINSIRVSAEEEKSGDIESWSDMYMGENQAPGYLRLLADMSPSAEVKTFLSLLISEIFPETLVSSFSFHGSKFEIRQCKSFWKKMEKMAHNIERACRKVLTIVERALNAWDRVKGKSDKDSDEPGQSNSRNGAV